MNCWFVCECASKCTGLSGKQYNNICFPFLPRHKQAFITIATFRGASMARKPVKREYTCIILFSRVCGGGDTHKTRNLYGLSTLDFSDHNKRERE